MKNKLPQNDPSGSYRRKVTAARRIGQNKQCQCGERRPEALIAGHDPVTCFACERQTLGQVTNDNHHFASEANHSLTIAVPVNDHHAELSVAQYDWPKETRENPDGSPVLAAAGCVRGFVDTIIYLIKKGVIWIAEMLEALDKLLVEKFGREWWIGTPLEQFAPKYKSQLRS